VVKKISFTCSNCSELVEIDISAFEPSLAIKDYYFCKNQHKTELIIKNNKIFDKNTGIESDIDTFPNVPPHLKTFIKEAYACQNAKTDKAGAMITRLVLDGLLWEMHYRQKMVGQKVDKLKNDCSSQPFLTSNQAMCARVPLFETLSRLAGYHSHAQLDLLNVNSSEFAKYLYLVEAAIKERWQ